MEVKLVVVGGKNPGQEVPVAGPKFFIGRAEDCHLRPTSDLVSRHHAAILVEEGYVAVRDFGSKNGTFVNGERITNERELKTGDRLGFGPLEFDVELAVSVGGKKKPKVHDVQEAAARTVETAGDEDLDIFSLLGEEADTSPGTQSADTQPLSSTPVNGSSTGDATTIRTDPAQEQPPQKPSTEKKEKPTRGTGAPQKAKKPMAKDSGSAAEDLLRKFFSRK